MLDGYKIDTHAMIGHCITVQSEHIRPLTSGFLVGFTMTNSVSRTGGSDGRPGTRIAATIHRTYLFT